VFPYAVFYTLDEGAREVVIVAVLDQRRDPASARLRAR
jgi:plasmid stabilization system protein ParE